MVLFVRTTLLLFGAALLGLIINAARPAGVTLLREQATAACEAPTDQIVALTAQDAAVVCRDAATVIVDVRAHDLFQQGHLPEAIHLPCRRARLSSDVNEVLGRAQTVLVYGDGDEDAREVAQSLVSQGLPAFILSGGYGTWEQAGMACASGPCEDCKGLAGTHDHE